MVVSKKKGETVRFLKVNKENVNTHTHTKKERKTMCVPCFSCIVRYFLRTRPWPESEGARLSRSSFDEEVKDREVSGD